MDRSAILLDCELSSKFGQAKGSLELNNKPLIRHVVDAVKAVADEIIIVTASQENADKYSGIVGSNAKVMVVEEVAENSLVCALKGFQIAQGKFSLLLPLDAPFISRDVITLLFELCPGRSAVIPRWPDTQIEPLHAVYHTQSALEAAKLAIGEGNLDAPDLIEYLQGVRYVSTLVIQELDPDLKTFFRVKTPVDLKKAGVLAKPKPRKSK
jgi:molybdopterin-guanine dinucleotide biosynthesis protein A